MPPTRQAWERLAELLVQQRGRIDSNARRFAETTGLNQRIIYDIENARRTNFRAAKLGEIERAYRLRPGVIAEFLDGTTESLETDGAGPLTAPEAQGPDDEEWDGYLVGEPHLRPAETLRWKRLAPRRGYGRIRYVMTHTDPDTGLQDNPDTIFSDERDIWFVIQWFRELRHGYPDAVKRVDAPEGD